MDCSYVRLSRDVADDDIVIKSRWNRTERRYCVTCRGGLIATKEIVINPVNQKKRKEKKEEQETNTMQKPEKISWKDTNLALSTLGLWCSMCSRCAFCNTKHCRMIEGSRGFRIFFFCSPAPFPFLSFLLFLNIHFISFQFISFLCFLIKNC